MDRGIKMKFLIIISSLESSSGIIIKHQDINNILNSQDDYNKIKAVNKLLKNSLKLKKVSDNYQKILDQYYNEIKLKYSMKIENSIWNFFKIEEVNENRLQLYKQLKQMNINNEIKQLEKILEKEEKELNLIEPLAN